MIRQATLDDVEDIKKVAARHPHELGFLLRPVVIESINKSQLLYEDVSQGFCRYHKRRDGVTVLYEMCVPAEFRNRGISTAFINCLERPMQLKCPVDLKESNEFFQKRGFTLVETQPGKKRALNVWRLD